MPNGRKASSTTDPAVCTREFHDCCRPDGSVRTAAITSAPHAAIHSSVAANRPAGR